MLEKLIYSIRVCSLYNNIKPPSWLGPGTDFHLFKEGVEPKWEDPTCEFGGKWTVLIPKSPISKQVLDTYWLNAVSNLFHFDKPSWVAVAFKILMLISSCKLDALTIGAVV